MSVWNSWRIVHIFTEESSQILWIFRIKVYNVPLRLCHIVDEITRHRRSWDGWILGFESHFPNFLKRRRVKVFPFIFKKMFFAPSFPNFLKKHVSHNIFLAWRKTNFSHKSNFFQTFLQMCQDLALQTFFLCLIVNCWLAR